MIHSVVSYRRVEMGVVKIVVGVLFCIILPGILQTVGFAKDEWAASQNETCPTVGLRGNTCGQDYKIVYILQILPVLVFILPVAAIVFTFCGCADCIDDDDNGDDNSIAVVCALLTYTLWLSSILSVLLFPFLGILILTGCIMFSTHFATSALGPSFYLCLSAGICHIFGMMYLIVNHCRKKCRQREVEETTVSIPPSGAIQTVSQAVEYREERTVAYADDRGNFIFSREFKIIRIFE